MKTPIYCLVFFMLLLDACSNIDSVVVSPYEMTGKSTGKVVETAVVTSKTPLPFITEYDLARKGVTNSSARVAQRASSGPFTQAGNLRLLFSNKKVFLSSNQSLYPVGLYFCDVYICDLVVSLPSGQFLGLMGSSKVGYNDFNTQTTGINNTQVLMPSGGSDYIISTYSLVPNTNAAGQSIYAGTIPQDLTGLTYTYLIFP